MQAAKLGQIQNLAGQIIMVDLSQTGGDRAKSGPVDADRQLKLTESFVHLLTGEIDVDRRPRRSPPPAKAPNLGHRAGPRKSPFIPPSESSTG